jgi:hypothetical protein
METKPVKVLKKKTGYQLFFRKRYQELLLESPGRSFGDCSKEIGGLWKNLTAGEKEKFNQSIEIENQSIEIENQSIEIENQSMKQSIEIENQSINQSIKKKENKEENDYNFRLPPILHPCRLKLNELYQKEFENHKLPLLYVSESKNIVGEFIKLQPNIGKKHKERLPSKSKFSMDSLEEDEEETEAFLEKMEIDDEDNDDVVESRLTEEEDEQKDGEENEEVEEELGSVEGRNDNENISRSDDDSESDGDSEEDDDVSLIVDYMEDEICI